MSKPADSSMPEHSIANKIRASESHVARHVDSFASRAFWWGWTNIITTTATVMASGSLAAFGKNAAAAVGSRVSSATAVPDQVVAGWRSTCMMIAISAIVSYLSSRKLSEANEGLSRSRLMRASLKNLTVDLEDTGRGPEQVVRDYQRLNDAYPELVNSP